MYTIGIPALFALILFIWQPEHTRRGDQRWSEQRADKLRMSVNERKQVSMHLRLHAGALPLFVLANAT